MESIMLLFVILTSPTWVTSFAKKPSDILIFVSSVGIAVGVKHVTDNIQRH